LVKDGVFLMSEAKIPRSLRSLGMTTKGRSAGTSGNIFIGTSGWNYPHWGDGVFYPPELRQRAWLAFYADHFQTVEINNSFYHLPKKETFENWRDTVPEGFIFAVKVSRFVTHMKKLSEPESSMKAFLENVSGLGRKLGPLLFQLPPFWKVNIERLESMLKYLKSQSLVRRPVCVFEFRNPTWVCDEVGGLLRRYRASLCLADWPNLNVRDPRRSGIIYIRRHGPQELYASGYAEPELRSEAKKIREWAGVGKRVFCYFNNDAGGRAVHDAKKLIRFISQ